MSHGIQPVDPSLILSYFAQSPFYEDSPLTFDDFSDTTKWIRKDSKSCSISFSAGKMRIQTAVAGTTASLDGFCGVMSRFRLFPKLNATSRPELKFQIHVSNFSAGFGDNAKKLSTTAKMVMACFGIVGNEAPVFQGFGHTGYLNNFPRIARGYVGSNNGMTQGASFTIDATDRAIGTYYDYRSVWNGDSGVTEGISCINGDLSIDGGAFASANIAAYQWYSAYLFGTPLLVGVWFNEMDQHVDVTIDNVQILTGKLRGYI